MKELKVFLSQFHDGDFHDEVSGIVFKQSLTLDVYNIKLEDDKVAGIQAALRKNILVPYHVKTRDFVNNNDLTKQVKAVKPVEQVEVELVVPETPAPVEEVKVEAAVEAVEEKVEAKEAPKKTRKRTPKKEETN